MIRFATAALALAATALPACGVSEAVDTSLLVVLGCPGTEDLLALNGYEECAFIFPIAGDVGAEVTFRGEKLGRVRLTPNPDLGGWSFLSVTGLGHRGPLEVTLDIDDPASCREALQEIGDAVEISGGPGTPHMGYAELLIDVDKTYVERCSFAYFIP